MNTDFDMNRTRAAAQNTDPAGEEKKKGITGCTLKMIALITMLIDHIGATIVERLVYYSGTFSGDLWQKWYDFYIALRLIGRMAFPIYCFLLVEGFYHTRNRKKYAGRLFLFALISEVPFDLAFWQSYFDFSHNNVFFTLLLGLLCIWSLDELQKKAEEGWSMAAVKALSCLSALAFAAAAEWGLHTDYGAAGILTILLLYRFYHSKRELGFVLAVIFLGILSSYLEFAAILMVFPLHFYNGKRGHQIRYLFYAFYPVHLTILAGICYLMGLGI